MNLKKYNLYQTSAGILEGHYIGCVFAETFHMIGDTALFQIGATVVSIMNFVKVEECIIED